MSRVGGADVAVVGSSTRGLNPSTSSTPIAAAFTTHRASPPISPDHHDALTHVQAIHDFAPSLLASTAATANPGMYLSFKSGEVIRVHVRDVSGWWDGEIAATEVGASTERQGRRRGWFPSNYVREISHDGSLHRRAESTAKSESTASPKSRRTNMSISTIHSRQTSTTSHISRDSQNDQSPTHRSMALLPPNLQSLLHPVVQALSLIDAAIHAGRRAHIQPGAACVISAVRAVLSSTDCLVKDSATLAEFPQLGRERKAILAELSKLVAAAKTVGGVESLDQPAVIGEAKDFELLARAARSVFAGMKRFLQYCNDYNVQPRPLENVDISPVAGPDTALSSSAIQSKQAVASDSSSGYVTRARFNSAGNTNTRIQETFRMRAASVDDLRAIRKRSSSPPPPMPQTAKIITTSDPSRQAQASSPTSASTPVSVSFPSSSSGRSSPISFSSSRKHRLPSAVDSISTIHSTIPDDDAHTLDETSASALPTSRSDVALASSVDVLEAISQAEDALLSIIAAFIGHLHSHHIGSHPSSHANLLEMTRETIDCVRDLLTVVEAVGRDVSIRQIRPRDIEHLRVAKDNLYEIASRLVEGVEVIGNAPFTDTSEEEYEVVKSRLLSTATATLRGGTECVRLVRICVPEDTDPFASTPVPRSADGSNRQVTPRPVPHDAAVVLRERIVGQRGAHTLSGLHRKASSLSLLQKRFKSGESLDAMVEDASEQGDGEEDEDEEVVEDTSREEDVTLRPVASVSKPFPGAAQRPTFVRTQTSPTFDFTAPRSAGLLGTFSRDDIPVVRSRSSSLTSPSPPVRMTHRSPSGSADLTRAAGTFGPFAGGRRPSNVRSTTYSGSPVETASIRSSSSPRSSALSEQATPLPVTPHVLEDAPETTDSSLLGYLTPDVPHSDMPPVHALTLDTDLTPVKTLTVDRPAGPERAMTAPIPGHGDARFWMIAHDYDPREITFNQEGTMVGASLTVLVETMTPHDGPVEHTFWTTFFYTFRLFTTPSQLVTALIARYDLQLPVGIVLGERERAIWIESKVVPVRLRIYNLLKAWLETYWRPETDDVVLDTLKEFSTEVVNRTLPAMAPRLEQAIRKRQSGPLTSSTSSDAHSLRRSSLSDKLARTPASAIPPLHGALPPTPIISKSLNSLLQKNPSSASVTITDFDSVELARQLTIMESKLFCLVTPEDLLQTGKKSIPELKALSTLSNQITGWVADNILNELDAKKRASLLKFYIKLADKCLAMNNFSTMFAVLAGLNSSIVLRLKKTWEALSAKYKLTMDRLQTVIDHSKNHAVYRARLRDAESPCLPFLGLILTDITFMSDGNPDTRASAMSPDLQLINLDKYIKLGKIALDFKRYQQPYHFHELEVVQTFLRRTLAERGSSSLDALYRKSLMLEPRQRSEKISSAVEKPGWLGTRI